MRSSAQARCRSAMATSRDSFTATSEGNLISALVLAIAKVTGGTARRALTLPSVMWRSFVRPPAG